MWAYSFYTRFFHVNWKHKKFSYLKRVYITFILVFSF